VIKKRLYIKQGSEKMFELEENQKTLEALKIKINELGESL